MRRHLRDGREATGDGGEGDGRRREHLRDGSSLEEVRQACNEASNGSLEGFGYGLGVPCLVINAQQADDEVTRELIGHERVDDARVDVALGVVQGAEQVALRRRGINLPHLSRGQPHRVDVGLQVAIRPNSQVGPTCSMPSLMISRAVARASAMHASFKPPFLSCQMSAPGMPRIHASASAGKICGNAALANASGLPAECRAVSTELLPPLASIRQGRHCSRQRIDIDAATQCSVHLATSCTIDEHATVFDKLLPRLTRLVDSMSVIRFRLAVLREDMSSDMSAARTVNHSVRTGGRIRWDSEGSQSALPSTNRTRRASIFRISRAASHIG
jgi:hypothetical protein